MSFRVLFFFIVRYDQLSMERRRNAPMSFPINKLKINLHISKPMKRAATLNKSPPLVFSLNFLSGYYRIMNLEKSYF